MKLAVGSAYRLFEHGGPGLSCSEAGIGLGDVPLVQIVEGGGVRRSEVRSLDDLGAILALAYGEQRPDVLQRCHRGLTRAARRLEDGDVALAALEAVMIGFPNLAPSGLAKLAMFADLEKAGDAWEDQPRVPSGQTGGGQWTSEGGGGGDAGTPAPTSGSQPGSGSNSDGAAPASPRPPKTESQFPLLDDGVYRPDRDQPAVTLTGGAEDAEEGFRHGIGGNEPPPDYTSLVDVFPGFRDNPGVAVTLAPIDSFLDISGAAGEANLAATEAEYARLSAQIRALDPTWRDDELQSLGDMSWQARANVIDSLRMERAVDYYKLRGDIGPLQVETLRFLQNSVDREYEAALSLSKAGNLRVRLSDAEAIGNAVDAAVRDQLKEFFNVWKVPFGPGQNITVNNRDPSTEDQTYRVPDARLGKVSFDWSLVLKTVTTPQVRSFFAADSKPDAVVIVRPTKLGGDSAYLIPRPASMRKVAMPREYKPYVPQTIGDLLDKLGFMTLNSPTFADKTGYFPERNVDNTFGALNDGLLNLRPKLGQPLYDKLAEMSGQMRAFFEADPEDETGEAQKGRLIIFEMEDLLKAAARKTRIP